MASRSRQPRGREGRRNSKRVRKEEKEKGEGRKEKKEQKRERRKGGRLEKGWRGGLGGWGGHAGVGQTFKEWCAQGYRAGDNIWCSESGIRRLWCHKLNRRGFELDPIRYQKRRDHGGKVGEIVKTWDPKVKVLDGKGEVEKGAERVGRRAERMGRTRCGGAGRKRQGNRNGGPLWPGKPAPVGCGIAGRCSDWIMGAWVGLKGWRTMWVYMHSVCRCGVCALIRGCCVTRQPRREWSTQQGEKHKFVWVKCVGKLLVVWYAGEGERRVQEWPCNSCWANLGKCSKSKRGAM